jgi:hypothetical protein
MVPALSSAAVGLVLGDIRQFEDFVAILTFDVKIVVDLDEGPARHGLHGTVAPLGA